MQSVILWCQTLVSVKLFLSVADYETLVWLPAVAMWFFDLRVNSFFPSGLHSIIQFNFCLDAPLVSVWLAHYNQGTVICCGSENTDVDFFPYWTVPAWRKHLGRTDRSTSVVTPGFLPSHWPGVSLWPLSVRSYWSRQRQEQRGKFRVSVKSLQSSLQPVGQWQLSSMGMPSFRGAWAALSLLVICHQEGGILEES